jgi:hypothetical protein
MTIEFQKIESTISDHAVIGVLVKSVNNIEGFMEESVKSHWTVYEL